MQRVLGLAPSEVGRALPLFAYLFLTMAGSVASKAARDAMFLDRFPATALPYVDIAVAVLVGLIAGVYIRLGARTNLRNVQIASLLTFAATAVVFWWSAREAAAPAGEPAADRGTVFVLIYVWVGALSVLVPTQVWTLANFVMTTREAKRAFGLIGAGAILGWILGGVATRELVDRYGIESPLLWVAITLVVSAAIVWVVWRDRPPHLVDQDFTRAETASGGLWTSLGLVRRSPYLTAIASVIWLAAFVTTIAGWQFKAIAKENIPATDELAMFFGTFNVLAGIAALVLQVLFTGRILRSVGIGVTLFVVPMAMVISSAGLLIAGSLFAVAALKASDQVLRYSLDKATVELLYLPVPATLMFRVKSFIDTVVFRVGDALGGLAILLFASVLGLSAVQMAWIALIALAGWLWAAFVARLQYVENLRESIYQHRVDAERSAAPVIERAASDLLVAQLQTGTPEQILYALNLLEASNDRRAYPVVRDLVSHDSPEVRALAVRMLARYGDATLNETIERLLYDPHLEVRTEALLYLTQHAHIDPLERIEQLGEFPDFSLRAAMAAFLARPGRGQNVDAARAIVAAMVREQGAAGRRTRLEAAQLLAAVPDLFDQELRILLDDPDPEVVGAAIRAVGKLRKRSLIPRVIKRLAQPGLADVAVAVFAGMGDAVAGTLRDHLVDPETQVEVRREIPVVLQAIATPAAQFVLMESVLDSDSIVRHRIITALNKLGQIYPDRRVDRRLIETVLGAEIMGHYRSYQVLATLGARLDAAADPVVRRLTESMQQEAERVFRLLTILYPGTDMHSAYVGLTTGDPVVHDNAIEFLETVLSPQLRELIVPLFDRGVSLAQRGHLANRLLGASLGDRDEAASVLMLSQDPWLQSCAAYTIGEFRLTQFADQIETWCTHADPLLRATAEDARRKLHA
ncbi:MAG TPA: Npt1/Npt2 family nucleotide transporter [Vicinamibacterales bacterium]|nr:Npt1/Npt2 family nucleotide transporter [Vicinamibacterales bacterium]